MASPSELAVCTSDLAAAADALAAQLRRQDESRGSGSSAPESIDLAEDQGHVYGAQRALLAAVNRVQAMLRQPSDFLRGLALHTQLLACLQWLCEFQVLACVPLDDPVAFKDVADICGVPEDQLCRVTRLMATAGFLREARPGHIAHSPLSAQFVTEPGLLDAALFLSGTAAPAALKMPLATRRFPASDRADQCAYAAAFDTDVPLASVFELRPRLQRQFATYLAFVTSDDQAGVRDVLMQVDWASLGNATVVDVGASSPSRAISLASLFPALQFVVQTYEPSSTGSPHSLVLGSLIRSSSGTSIGGGGGGGVCLTSPSGPPGSGQQQQQQQQSQTQQQQQQQPPSPTSEIPGYLTNKITLQKRIPGTTQFVRSATVYMLHLPSPSPSLPWSAVSSHAVAELTAHLDVLRANPAARVILTALVLPTHGAVDAEMEAAARVRDLSLLQLANGRHAETAEVVEMLGGIRGGNGGFVLTDEIRSPTSAFVAWEIRYQAYEDLKR